MPVRGWGTQVRPWRVHCLPWMCWPGVSTIGSGGGSSPSTVTVTRALTVAVPDTAFSPTTFTAARFEITAWPSTALAPVEVVTRPAALAELAP